MDRINVILPDQTIAKLRKLTAAGSRSQFVNYAVLAMLATLRADGYTAEQYEKAAWALVGGSRRRVRHTATLADDDGDYRE